MTTKGGCTTTVKPPAGSLFFSCRTWRSKSAGAGPAASRQRPIHSRNSEVAIQTPIRMVGLPEKHGSSFSFDDRERRRVSPIIAWASEVPEKWGRFLVEIGPKV